MDEDFEARQIIVAHPEIWDALRQWATARQWPLVALRTGGDLPTYGFAPLL